MESAFSLMMSRDIFWGLLGSVVLFIVFAWYMMKGSGERLKLGEKWMIFAGFIGLIIWLADAVLQLWVGRLI